MSLFRKIRPALSKIKHGVLVESIAAKSILIRLCSRYHKCIYFISTPTHGNLGDHAIVYAQYQMMQSIGAGKNVIEITRYQYERNRNKLERIIQPQDLIIIDGGGNIGTLWIEEEYKMRDIIQRFPSNPIFIFPQTAYFSDDAKGREELKKSVSIYSGHEKLIVFCRDRDSLRLLKTKFPAVKSYYTPDIVLSLSVECNASRNGVLLCFRNDKEKVTSENIVEQLEAVLSKEGYSVSRTSTLVQKNVYKRDRLEELNKKWEEFSKTQLVITDRLHGMIFCAITGTPCVALDNLSHKVLNGYEWIKQLPYISCCTDEAQILEAAHKLLNTAGNYRYMAYDINMDFDVIREELLNALCT